MVNDFLEAGKIRGFPTFEEVNEPLCESFKIIWFLDQAIPLANSGELHGDVSEVFEIADGLDDFFFAFSDFGGAFPGVELRPFVSGFSGSKELTKKDLPGGVEAIEEMFEIPCEADLVSGVKGARGHEVAFELEISEKGIDDKGTNVV